MSLFQSDIDQESDSMSKYDRLIRELRDSFAQEAEASKDHADYRLSDYLTGVADGWTEAVGLLEVVIFLVEGYES